MPTEPVLSVYEQWRLLVWMETHPAALAHEPGGGQPPGRRPHASGRAPLAYAVGAAVGTLWRVLGRWR